VGAVPTPRLVESADRGTGTHWQGDDNCIEEMFGLSMYFKYEASISIHKAM
jgi:hypothetical protein